MGLHCYYIFDVIKINSASKTNRIFLFQFSHFASLLGLLGGFVQFCGFKQILHIYQYYFHYIGRLKFVIFYYHQQSSKRVQMNIKIYRRQGIKVTLFTVKRQQIPEINENVTTFIIEHEHIYIKIKIINKMEFLQNCMKICDYIHQIHFTNAWSLKHLYLFCIREHLKFQNTKIRTFTCRKIQKHFVFSAKHLIFDTIKQITKTELNSYCFYESIHAFNTECIWSYIMYAIYKTMHVYAWQYKARKISR